MGKFKYILGVSILIFALGAGKVNAESKPDTVAKLFSPVHSVPFAEIKEEPKQADKPKKTKTYKVKEGDTLGTIAKAHNVSLERLWSKNLAVKHPDKIKLSQTLKIPQNNEKLKKRPFPSLPSQMTPVAESANRGSSPSLTPTVVADGSNTYTPGYCTWGVKNWASWVPNGLGNADTWDDNAPSYGLGVGNKPVVGAVGVTKAYMHVVLIVGVKGNQVHVKEMNYGGLYVTSYRWTDKNEFTYIYP